MGAAGASRSAAADYEWGAASSSDVGHLLLPLLLGVV